MARPTNVELLKPVKIKFKYFDDALEKIKEASQREPPRITEIGLNVGMAQGLYIDLISSLNRRGHIKEDEENSQQIETSLNEIESLLKENNVNVPLISFSVGLAIVSSNLLKDKIGLTSPPVSNSRSSSAKSGN